MRLLAALLALGLPAVALAQGPRTACPARGTPAVEVVLRDPEPQMLPPVPSAQLGVAPAVGLPGSHPLGVTAARVEFSSEISARTLGPRAGPACAVPAALRIELSHAEHTFRLAQEVPAGSCLEREVLAHEARHVEVNRRTLREAAEALRAVARDWAGQAEARGPDRGAAMAALQADLSRRLSPFWERLDAERAAAHAAIDTEAEYRRLGSACPEDRRVLRGLGRAH